MMGIEYDETRRTWVRATPSTIRSGAWSHVYLDQKVTVRDVGANCRTVKRLIGEADNQVMIDVITCQEPEEGEWFQIK